MPTTKHSAIEVQISARVHRPKNGRRITESLIRAAIKRKVETGEDVPGIELTIVHWKRGAIEHAASNSADEWARFGRFLPQASISIREIE